MRLLIVGSLGGQIGAATKIAIEKGAKVAHAGTVELALAELRQGRGADLIMADIVLDIGLLVRSLASERICTPVVACGIGTDARRAVDAIRAGAKEYVPLPPDPALIAAVLCDWRREAFAKQPCPTIDARIPVFAEYRARGTDAALKLHSRLLRKHANEYELGSRQLNSLGYQVMRGGDLAGAVRFFELTAKLFPGEWNVHDSLGEAYAAAKQPEAAIRSYQRSVELNPGNDNGKQALRDLGALEQ